MDLMQSVGVNSRVTRINSTVQPMLSNHIQEIRECYQQAAHCAQQAEAQNDAKVKKQLLELTRLWLLLARGYESAAH
jgi:predicted transposase YbfD/YdcC